ALQAGPTHQPFHRAAGRRDAFPVQLAPHLARPVGLAVLLPDPVDLRRQRLLPVPAWGLAHRVDLAAGVVVVRRRGDRQHLADRLDPVGVPVLIDEVLQDLYRRSSSAWAKNADALRRISLAWRS